jgi:hypothetical protein
MMTKWDSIQMDILPIEPKIWGDENEFQDEYENEDVEFSLDEWEEMR